MKNRYQIITPRELENYQDLADEIAVIAWPEFMLHDPIANKNWGALFDRFEDFQFALFDNEKKIMAAMGNSVPFYFDKPVDDLPEEGWDWVFLKAIEDHKNNIKPNMQSAIQVAIRPEYQGQGISKIMLEAMRAIGKARGFKSLVAPVRPNEKAKYPLQSIDDYVAWKTADGFPFDAWMRVHARAGARVVKPCRASMTIRATIAEWEKWTGMKFLHSGEYVVPGALTTIRVDMEKDDVLYLEPNVWMEHTL